MSRFVYDTNCWIALRSIEHVHHPPTAGDWRRRTQAGQTAVLALNCLTEFYSIATGLPRRERMLPLDAWSFVRRLADEFPVVSLTQDEVMSEFERMAAAGVPDGQIYDGFIASCARKAGAQTLVTWNLRHFARFAADDLAIVNPLGERA